MDLKITLDPTNHTYKDNFGREYISVTTLIAKHYPFDEKKIAAECIQRKSSKYYGKTVEQVLEMWKETSVKGTTLHNAVEKFIKEKKIECDPLDRPLIEQFSKLRFTGSLSSETVIGDVGLLIAGTIDILEDTGKKLWVWDIKTSNTIDYDKHLKYSVQLELYKKFAEEWFKKPVQIGGIIWFERYRELKDKTKIRALRPYKVDDLVYHMLAQRRKELYNLKKA